ncbi:Arginine/ornithine antiporter ArcD [hydrothermal vent metagenome]|uniref:Arginine/ornithine antiporter ArcD n=1 Tax=hydrothermal vent metagenome TaxID=652676 RepID=A0A1W1E8W8_9ZZZZ
MRLGLYIFAALTLMGIVGAVVHMINPNNFLIEAMGINFNFPVAVWVILPMFLLLVFTVIHMFYYGMKSYFKKKKWERDAETLEDALYWSLVNEPKEQKYMVNEIKKSAVLLGKSNLTVIDGVEGLSDRLTKIVNILNKIKNGEYVDLKEHKLLKVFNEGNPHLIKNRLNRLESDSEFVEEVMKSSSKYSKPVQQHALAIFAKNESFFKARKYAKIFDVENFFVMLNRLDEEEELGLTAEILNDFVEALKLRCADFVRIAKITKKHFSPNENLALFKAYQKDNPKAQNAYLYLLFEYELLDEIEKYLDEQEEHEFMKYRALYELKKQNKGFKLEDLIDAESICKNV